MRRHAAGWGPERAVKFTGPGLRPSHPPHSIQIRLLDQRAEISFLELAFPSESLSREEESEVLYESCFLVPSLKSASQTGYFGAPRERTSRRSFAIPGGSPYGTSTARSVQTPRLALVLISAPRAAQESSELLS